MVNILYIMFGGKLDTRQKNIILSIATDLKKLASNYVEKKIRKPVEKKINPYNPEIRYFFDVVLDKNEKYGQWKQKWGPILKKRYSDIKKQHDKESEQYRIADKLWNDFKSGKFKNEFLVHQNMHIVPKSNQKFTEDTENEINLLLSKILETKSEEEYDAMRMKVQNIIKGKFPTYFSDHDPLGPRANAVIKRALTGIAEDKYKPKNLIKDVTDRKSRLLTRRVRYERAGRKKLRK